MAREVSPRREGFLVLRAWVEPADGAQLRVRVSRGGPRESPESSVLVTATPEAALDYVRAWLESLTAPLDE